jgi:hypothetical protein
MTLERLFVVGGYVNGPRLDGGSGQRKTRVPLGNRMRFMVTRQNNDR